MAAHTDVQTQYALAPGEGQGMSWFTATLVLKAATADIGVVEVEIKPGEEPPMHVHSREDEWFYVLEGDATFHVGEETYRAPTGTFISMPRAIPHTFTVQSASARFLMLNAPGGFERMFELAPKTIDDAMAAFERYGVRAVGPHPRDARSSANGSAS
jgi:quercetin dioxygenase-like cupin family protein